MVLNEKSVTKQLINKGHDTPHKDLTPAIAKWQRPQAMPHPLEIVTETRALRPKSRRSLPQRSRGLKPLGHLRNRSLHAVCAQLHLRAQRREGRKHRGKVLAQIPAPQDRCANARVEARVKGRDEGAPNEQKGNSEGSWYMYV